MIKTFADKQTETLYLPGRSRRLPPNLIQGTVHRLEFLEYATTLEDLKVPPSNRIHDLKDDRTGQYSISINDPWRICFTFHNGDAYDVEITDYH